MEPYESNELKEIPSGREEDAASGLPPLEEINDRAQRDYDDKFKKYTEALEQGKMDQAKSILPSLRVAARYRNHMKADDGSER